jgi:hypothetical protein
LVRTHFAQITPAHLLAIEADIKAPLVFSNANSYDDHVAKITHLNNGLVAAGRTRSQVDQTSDFRASIMTSAYASIFAPFFSVYDVAYRTVATQNFTAMHQAAGAAIPQLLTTLHAASTLSQFGANGALSNLNPNPIKGLNLNRRPMTTTGSPAYCWTHGTTFHSSTACRNKATGHQDKATATNKMGGKN